MTDTAVEQRKTSTGRGPGMLPEPPERSRGRMLVVLVLVIAIAATAATRWFAQNQRDRATHADQHLAASGRSSLGELPSYATALLLGGLRGPLVMALWMNSETNKSEHNLQDVDTEIEWIRLLQPEFDTVHLFQVWNKAYNLSVQMSTLADKYTTILDAIEYAKSVDREKPDDINIISVLGQVYSDKLGNSQEKAYYESRVRHETMAPQPLVRVTLPASRADDFRAAARIAEKNEDIAEDAADRLAVDEPHGTATVVVTKNIADRLRKTFNGDGVKYEDEKRSAEAPRTPGWRRVRLDPMLDEAGNVLPELIHPRFPRPTGTDPLNWYDGSDMQFLPQYQPYPYGISALAIGYNYYKRAQLLQSLDGQRHIQSGDSVVDSRPGLGLEVWGRSEWERGRRAEIQAFGRVPPSDRPALENVVAAAALASPVADTEALEKSLYSYQLTAKLMHDGRAEFQRHVSDPNYASNSGVYASHIDDTIGIEAISQADFAYLRASAPAGSPYHVDDQAKLRDDARAGYMKAVQQFSLIVLKYYMDDSIARRIFPKDATGKQYGRENIDKLDPSQYLPLAVASLNELDAEMKSGQMRYDQSSDDRGEYLGYIIRAETRLKQLGVTLPAEIQ